MVTHVIRATFIEMDYDFDRRQWVNTLLAEIQVDGHRIVISGAVPEIVDPTMSIVDPATGRPLTFRDDPERWATLLPTAYRAGDVRVEVRVERGPLLAPLPAR